MRDSCIILDVAHGSETPHKESVDSVFKEFEWSRARVHDIYKGLMDFNLPFDTFAPFMSYRNEPGLRKRVNVYNERAEPYKDTIMLSLHVDRFKEPPEWWNGTGFSFFTNRVENTADELANVMAKVWDEELPNERVRRRAEKDVSKDSNFTVIWGYGKGEAYVPTEYHGILVENLFMDNKSDVYNKLMNAEWNSRLVNTYITSIFKMFEYLGHMEIES